MTSPFESLPVEVQTEILTQKPTRFPFELPAHLRNIRLVSRGFRAIADRAYYEQICSEPVSHVEIDDYLGQEPILFGLFNQNIQGQSSKYAIVPVETTYNVFYNLGYDYDTATYVQSGADVRFQRDPDSSEISFIYNPMSPHSCCESGHSRLDFHDIQFKYRLYDTELDLVSTFRVVSSRLLCRHLDPNYARDFVRSLFHDHLVDPESLDLYDLCSLHLYLTGTCRVMNLPVPRIQSIGSEMEIPERTKEPDETNEDYDTTTRRDLDYYRFQDWPIDSNDATTIQVMKEQIPKLITMIERQIDHLVVP
jgi:hypothetical protein